MLSNRAVVHVPALCVQEGPWEQTGSSNDAVSIQFSYKAGIHHACSTCHECVTPAGTPWNKLDGNLVAKAQVYGKVDRA